MSKDFILNSDTLHHAYCIEGERGAVVPSLRLYFDEELGFPTKGNPDFLVGEFETFGIEDGRTLKECAMRKPLGQLNGRKFFVVATRAITHEAQNSLLKIFEEPPPNTHFFLIVPSFKILLPTLRSRLFLIPREDEVEFDSTKEKFVDIFLHAKSSKRIELLKELIDEKDKDRAARFLEALIHRMRAKTNLTERNKEDIFILEELERCRRYLEDRAPSVKMILEHISLVTPAVKK